MTKFEILHIVIGSTATIIFFVQNFSSILGGADADCDIDSHGDFHGDFESGEHHLSGYLSVRNLVAFFMGYGWITFVSLKTNLSESFSGLLGIVAGLVFVTASMAILRILSNLQEDGTIDVSKLVGKSATVYIAIGAKGSKMGKIFVDTPAGRKELQARSNAENAIKAGEFVVIEKAEDEILWVLPA